MSGRDSQPTGLASKSESLCWLTFLNARATAIDWLIKEFGYTDEQVAKHLSMDPVQVRLIRERDRRLDVQHPETTCSGWQPIGTAPKDGTQFLACVADGYPRTVACVNWEPVHESWACSWDNWPVEEFAPTHWRQLPTPPVKTNCSEKDAT